MEIHHEQLALGKHLAEIAVNGALKVAPYVLRVFEGGTKAEEKKGYFDLVTEADRNTEAMLVEYLLQSYPNSSVLGEENGAQGMGTVGWIIDPIDGTNNFVAGIPFFCISIGVLYQDQGIAGVIYDPMRKDLFYASPEGAFLNGRPIQSFGHSTEHTALLFTGFPYEGGVSDQADFDYYQKIVQSFHAVRRLGSTALELAYVACGRADVTFQMNANPWDVVAGMVLIERAGGQYTAPKNSNFPDSPWKSPRFIGACANFAWGESVLKDLFTYRVKE
jgi:myo-inositol-1(or 4)-monophosphatase